MVLLVYLQGAAAIFRVHRHNHRGPVCEGRGLTHALTDTAPTDLTVATRTHRWVPSHSPTVSCAYRAAGWRQSLPTCSSSMPSSARAAASACRRAEALEVRYRAAAGVAVGEEAHSRQPH
eukprot:scaffold2815_cov72-Phaeocystis_antarctica.AAC.1